MNETVFPETLVSILASEHGHLEVRALRLVRLRGGTRDAWLCLLRFHQVCDRGTDLVPAILLGREVFPACCRQAIELGALVVISLPPFRFESALLLQPV